MYKVNVDDNLFCFHQVLLNPIFETRYNPKAGYESVTVGWRVVGVTFDGKEKHLSATITKEEAVSMTSSIFNSRKRKFTIKGGKLCP